MADIGIGVGRLVLLARDVEFVADQALVAGKGRADAAFGFGEAAFLHGDARRHAREEGFGAPQRRLRQARAVADLGEGGFHLGKLGLRGLEIAKLQGRGDDALVGRHARRHVGRGRDAALVHRQGGARVSRLLFAQRPLLEIARDQKLADARGDANLVGALVIGDALVGAPELVGRDPAFEQEVGEIGRGEIRGRLGIRLRERRGDPGGIGLLLVEDGGDVRDRSRRRTEALALELGGDLPRLREAHGRPAVGLAARQQGKGKHANACRRGKRHTIRFGHSPFPRPQEATFGAYQFVDGQKISSLPAWIR